MTKLRACAAAAILGLLGLTAVAAAPPAQARTVSVCITVIPLGIPTTCIQV